MKKTTYIILGTLILLPFIFILLTLVPEKKRFTVFNLTKITDRKLEMVHNVVFDGRIDFRRHFHFLTFSFNDQRRYLTM